MLRNLVQMLNKDLSDVVRDMLDEYILEVEYEEG